jgi:DNA-binding SARP family transcriptional activator
MAAAGSSAPISAGTPPAHPGHHEQVSLTGQPKSHSFGWPLHAQASVRLRLLGSFSLTVDGRIARLPFSVQRLIAFLGMTRQADRHTAAGSLWPDVTEARASCSLRAVLSKIQQLCPYTVESRSNYLILSPVVGVDTLFLRKVATRVAARSADAIQDALALLDLRGELLPTWDEEWLTFEREELRQIRLQALDCCTAQLYRSGHLAGAMMLAFEAIRADPLRESAYRLVVAIHMAQGNRAQALHAYRAYADNLWLEYRIRPSPLFKDLVQNPDRIPTKPRLATGATYIDEHEHRDLL